MDLLPFRLAIKIKHPIERLNQSPEKIAEELYYCRNRLISEVGFECDFGGRTFVVDPGDTLELITQRVVEASKCGDKATWSFFPPGAFCGGVKGSGRDLPLIYIAGPFRAATPWEIECNIRRAETLGLEVARLGGIPIIPHTMYRFFQNALSDEFWLKCELQLLKPCNALAAVVGWEKSKGTQGEIRYAEDELKIPVFRDSSTALLWNWIQQWKASNDQT